MTLEKLEEIISWGYIRITTKGERRRDGSTANTHPGRVVRILKEKGLVHLDDDKRDYTYAIVGFFHDMIEDGEATYEEISEIAGKEVADIVKILSKDPNRKKEEGYMDEYIAGIAQNEIARLVKVADRIENITESDGLKNKRSYIQETERWFVDLAKGTIFEEDFNKALQELKDKAEAEELKAKDRED